MECEEIRVDLRTIPHSADRQRSAQLLFRLNHTLPFSEEHNALLRELLGKNLGEGSTIAPPLSGATLDMLNKYDVRYMWICGGKRLSFATINRFRTNHMIKCID